MHIKSGLILAAVLALATATATSESYSKSPAQLALDLHLSFADTPATHTTKFSTPTVPALAAALHRTFPSLPAPTNPSIPTVSPVYTAAYTATTDMGTIHFVDAHNGPAGRQALQYEIEDEHISGHFFRSSTPSGTFYYIQPAAADPGCSRTPYTEPASLFVIPDSAVFLGENQCTRSELCSIWEWVDESDGAYFTAQITTESATPVFWAASSLQSGFWAIEVTEWTPEVAEEDLEVISECLAKPEVSKNFQGDYNGWLLLNGHDDLLDFNEWNVNANWDTEFYRHDMHGYNPDIPLKFQEAYLIRRDQAMTYYWDPETEGCLPWEYEGHEQFPRYFLHEQSELIEVVDCLEDQVCEVWGLNGFDTPNPQNDDRMETTLVPVPGSDTYMPVLHRYLTILYQHTEEQIIYEKRWNSWSNDAPPADWERWEVPEQCLQ